MESGKSWKDNPASSNVARSDRPREHVLQDRVRDFLKKYPVGTPVWFWKTLPDGPKVAATIRSAPFAEQDEVRCFLHGVRGVVSSDFISPRETEAPTPPRPEPSPAASTCVNVVGSFPKPTSVTRSMFEEAAGRAVTIAGGGAEDVLFGVRTRPGENARELRDELREKLPGGKFRVEGQP